MSFPRQDIQAAIVQNARLNSAMLNNQQPRPRGTVAVIGNCGTGYWLLAAIM
ncbi:MAG: hypothetical protein OXD33_06985 [Rhodobacteraceae bacterium]|nr:hypothetical protein [Paracoccaceae bacterium]